MIPETNVLLNLLVLAVSIFLLTKSAGFLVDGSVGIASIFHVPKLIIGIILVSFATTAPEFTVTIIASLRDAPQIVVGNAVGSVIADNGLALAIGILVAPTVLAVDRRTMRVLGLFLLAVAGLCFAFIADGEMGRLDGAFLLFLLLVYVAWLFLAERRRRSGQGDHLITGDVDERVKPGGVGLQILRFALGIAGLVLASRLLVDSAVNIAHVLRVSEAVIGLTIVAMGTSLPEIATSVVAFRKGHGDLALGDVLGANVLNILWIIGTGATITPIQVPWGVIMFSFPAMLISIVMLLVLATFGRRLQKWKGYVLLGGYIVYLSLAGYLFYARPMVA